MTRPVLLPLPGNEALADALAREMDSERGTLETRRFPDGESYIRIASDVEARAVVLVCTLDRPDDKTNPLIFAAETARELGASSVGLVAPYLPYMRQDRRFRPGEAVSARHFARLLAGVVDWLATVDPHLHRIRRLDDIYAIPTRVTHAAPLLAEWIRQNISDPLIVGPDVESEQWVAAVAAMASAPFVTFRKERLGDRKVRMVAPDLQPWSGRSPVLVDDIVSSGRTIVEASKLIVAAGLETPVCVAVHALLDAASEASLAGHVSRLVSTSTVPHPTSAIDISAPLARSCLDLLRRSSQSSRPSPPHGDH